MIQDFFTQLTSFVEGLDAWQQVLALVPVGAIPFIESYLGSMLGTIVGIHPLVAIPAAVLGNLLCTFGIIALTGRARDAVTRGRGDARGVARAADAESGFRKKVATSLDKYGVPGVCLLGPLVVASQITAPTLVALGATRRQVYVWMGISIAAWGILFGLFGNLVGGAIA
ncbi:hypothetical protein ACT3SP_09445 [Brachybacterium sp. AOP43-C2-M15]|uniref:hypothetical protein n=1 Tax=Brachybacterium sp. AOP43-C2-M15 TaxID=3457661 RepID=UPI004033F057